MAETAAAGSECATPAAHPWIGELLLRLLGAALQILATWAGGACSDAGRGGGLLSGVRDRPRLEHAPCGASTSSTWRSILSGGAPLPPVFPMGCC